jgi:hypothetical protein
MTKEYTHLKNNFKRLSLLPPGFDMGYRFTPEIAPSKAIKLDFSGITYKLGVVLVTKYS